MYLRFHDSRLRVCMYVPSKKRVDGWNGKAGLEEELIKRVQQS
jgi:hypothetical protein